ncbi:MAG: hypothetical protein R8K20_07035 [Gallionellaceae bacterium]
MHIITHRRIDGAADISAMRHLFAVPCVARQVRLPHKLARSVARQESTARINRIAAEIAGSAPGVVGGSVLQSVGVTY